MRFTDSNLLDRYTDKIKILSLDCYDTLLWRKVASPNDVFYDLQKRPAFQSLGITAAQRVAAERLARRVNYVEHGHPEVNLHEIYRLGFPSLHQNQLDLLIEDEIAEEKATCYPFPTIVQLIRDAKAKGLMVIIVSDTYLTEHLLRRKLSSLLPTDVYAAIEHVFCSCDYRVNKQKGLFKLVLEKLAVPPQTILHLGDKKPADEVAPKTVGIQGHQLVQHSEKISELLRLQSMAATFADAQIRCNRAMTSPFRGVFSLSQTPIEKPHQMIGYASLGPVMYAFARFICEDLEKMRTAGKKPKVIFLMRDGYLLSLACEAFAGVPIGPRVKISRFSATAASFRSKEDVRLYLAEHFKVWRMQVHCDQMLLPESVAKNIIETAKKEKNIEYAFGKLIEQDEVIKIIVENSATYFQRLKRYLEKQAGLEAGDTLVIIDIGYVGTAQRLLTPVLLNEMGIKEVQGRYLVAVDTPEWHFSKRGLVDTTWCDGRIMDLLMANFFLIEELCCDGGNSVIDYDHDGNVIYHTTSADENQIKKVNEIHNECLRFIHDTKQFLTAANTSLPFSMVRDLALAELIRCIYLQTTEEIEYLSAFEHDLNKSTSAKVPVFTDPNVESMWLRRRGLWFGQHSPHTLRTAADLKHMVMLMVERRFGLNLLPSDQSLRREDLTINVMRNGKQEKINYAATPTHDGFFSLPFFPVGMQAMQIEILFGKHYQWVQLESVELIKPEHFLSEEEGKNSRDITEFVIFNKMQERDKKLYQHTSMDSSLQINLPASFEPAVLRVVFRPIVHRKAV